ncbi:MAG TPA: hypothetical protein VIN10_01445 [Bacteroidales bacterium]
MRNNYGFIIILALAMLFPDVLFSQEEKSDENYTAYELMSKYYNEDFNPFKKRNVYVGFAFSLNDLQQENTTGLLQNVVNGQSLDYNLVFKGGYYINRYTMVGFNFSYTSDKFSGTVFRDPDTLQSNSISRGYDFTPNIRPSIPLSRNERLSVFIEMGLTFGYSTGLTRNVKNIDEVDKRYTEAFHFRAGISPGVTFFVIENFAFEAQLNVIGYDLLVSEQSVNDNAPARKVNQQIDANINLLSLKLGLAYYFGTKK